MTRGMWIPALFAALAVPLALGLVPRGRWYGFRTPRTLLSDEVWYPANRFFGVVWLLASLIWVATDLAFPRHAMSIGLGASAAAVLLSLLYLRRL